MIPVFLQREEFDAVREQMDGDPDEREVARRLFLLWDELINPEEMIDDVR